MQNDLHSQMHKCVPLYVDLTEHCMSLHQILADDIHCCVFLSSTVHVFGIYCCVMMCCYPTDDPIINCLFEKTAIHSFKYVTIENTLLAFSYAATVQLSFYWCMFCII